MGSNAKPVRVDRIVLHIGTEKTGTSSIQHFLSKNRVALADEGIVYPRFTGANGGSQWGVVAAVLKRPWKTDIGARLGIRDEAGADAYRQRLVNAIDNELLSCSGRHTLILSSEHFHSRLRAPARLEALKRLLGRWSDNVQVVVYFRRQDRVAISLYSTRLKSGQIAPKVFPLASRALPYYYDYERIYANWAEVFGEAAVQAGIFAPQHLAGGDLLTDFCGRAGIMEGGKVRPSKINESLSEAGAQLLLEINRQWPKKPLSGPNPSRELLVASIAKEHSGRSFPATRAQAKAFYERFIAGNARLAKSLFPDLGGQMFDEDFSEYPEALASPSVDASEEVRSRLRSWRAASVTEQKIGFGRWLLSARQLLSVVAIRGEAVVGALGRLLRRPLDISADAGLPPVFLHMGLPKTATTTLRNTLFSQHPGICYLLDKTSGQAAERSCATPEIYEALRPIFWRRAEPTDTNLVRSVLRDYSEAKGAEKPILGAWETLLIKPPEVFRALLREARYTMGDLHVMVTLRNPLKRLPSAYLHALSACAQNGKHHSIPQGSLFITFDDWLAGSHRWATQHEYRFDFEKNLRFAVDLLGRDKVGVFLMEDMVADRQAFFANIERFMGIGNVNAEMIADKHLNKGLTVAEFEFLQAIDASKVQRKQWLALSPQERRMNLKAIAQEGNVERCRVVLSDSQRELIESRSRDLNRWLVDTYGLELERHGYPL